MNPCEQDSVLSIDTGKFIRSYLMRRQLIVLAWLSLLVLAGLFIIHMSFGSDIEIGHPPTEVLEIIIARSILLLIEIAYLHKTRNDDQNLRIGWYSSLSIVFNLIFAFAIGYSSDLHDSHYHVLMLIPIVAAAFQFSMWGMMTVVVVATLLTFLQLILFYQRHPPIEVSEFFEASTMSVVYILIGPLVWLINRDLRNDRRRLSDSLSVLRITKDKLVAEEKLAAIGRLAGGLAHEIRNPVAMINSAIEMAAKSSTSEAIRTEMLQLAQSESNRLTRLTTDMLSYARTKLPEIREVPMKQSLEYVASLAKASAKGHVFVVQCDDSLKGEYDEFQVHQLLLNLVLNASDASIPESSVLLEGGRRSDGTNYLAVQNCGNPINAEHAAKIFEPFFTTKPGGTGLGLAIARNIALAHGGELLLAKNDQEGVRFELLLPRRKAS